MLKLLFILQGFFLIGNGAYMLLLPEHAVSNPVLEGVPDHVLKVLSLSSLSLGTCFAIAGWQNNRTIMKWSLLGRLLATVVFLSSGEPLSSVAKLESVVGVLTTVALYFYPDDRVAFVFIPGQSGDLQ